ncbi:MAG: 50S ribosomal protein L6 [Candidatus Taylorbacteria bacterium RIFCSPHIGHO2_02_FULL_46_13]|uniref:Large ribosomal subunit protein uL6 n=1 Tax=Candidatus Taylorbacteria bacterium RIFCSPHIGHO2_02_FULL_46_13 TaxID=1802312 RepID=A0A1G2MSJ2_9BACT|nr:MAG: 50S ribosomal protein L6 [Candidatus Taylorbacteria bacterium RIFCSPHIGHO2_02_FULL_46_13]
MSRIGKKPIPVPKGTTVTVSGRNVSVKGPLGELSREFKSSVAIEITADSVTVSPKILTNETKALWGTYASLIKSMMAGVNKVFEKRLAIEGIGYKADVKGTDIVLALGFSHPVKIAIPTGLKVVTEKGLITVSGINKEEVGRFAAELRSLKKPEPYKGKGIRYQGEVIKMKQGKKAASTTA